MDQVAGLPVPTASRGPGTLRPAPTGAASSLGAEIDVGQMPLRLVLRGATQDVHDRLHRHDGFAAIQDATIGRAEYRTLLMRLYGFYAPFEAAASIEHDRSRWIAADLETLGWLGPLDAIPCCPHIPSLHNAHLALGALYVAEGSALGGRDLARGLDRLFGDGVPQGRRFFIGRGPGTSQAWRNYLAELSAGPPDAAARAEIVRGAVETFAAFETWLSGWRTSSHD